MADLTFLLYGRERDTFIYFCYTLCLIDFFFFILFDFVILLDLLIDLTFMLYFFVLLL